MVKHNLVEVTNNYIYRRQDVSLQGNQDHQRMLDQN